MIIEEIEIIIKIFILGIFIAIMFDNISRSFNYIISVIIWIPLAYVICNVLLNITYEYRISYIIYYLFIFCLSFYMYYKFLKQCLNKNIDIIYNYITHNKLIAKICSELCLINEIRYIKIKAKMFFKKIKKKKIKKDAKTFDFKK